MIEEYRLQTLELLGASLVPSDREPSSREKTDKVSERASQPTDEEEVSSAEADPKKPETPEQE